MSQIENPGRPSLLSLAKLFARVGTHIHLPTTNLRKTNAKPEANTAISHLLTYPFRSNRASSLRNDVFNAAIRILLTHVTVPQARYLNPSTTQRYLSFCQSASQTPSSLSVTYGPGGKRRACAHWIGDPDAQVVILYLHGGAYFQPATAGTFLYVQSLIQKLGNQTGKSVAALVLAYSLAPEAAFPTQLEEGAAILSELLYPTSSSSKKRRPGDIFLLGDSAGGNIALALVSHLLRPHPQVEEFRLEGRLGGVLLYSPSVSHSFDWDSVRRNAVRDMLPVSKIPVWGAMYVGQTASLQHYDGSRLETDEYSEPCIAEALWWQELSKVVGYVLVLSGGEEALADSIHELGEKMKQGWREGGGEEKGVIFVETPRETHIGPIVDFMMSRGKVTSSSQHLLEEWLTARLEER